MSLIVLSLTSGLTLLSNILDEKQTSVWGNFGYACYYQFPKDVKAEAKKHVFISGTDKAGVDERWALVNLAGVDTRFELKKKVDAPGKKRKVGDLFTRTYTADGWKLGVEFVVTKACAPGPGCEGDTRDATLTVTKGNQQQVVKAVGYCSN